jgi:hypothetical protein
VDASAQCRKSQLRDRDQDASTSLIADAQDLLSIYLRSATQHTGRWCQRTRHDDVVNVAGVAP